MASYIPASFIKRFGTSHYALAAVVVAAAVGLRLAADPILGANSPYLPFVAAVLLAGRLGGRGPALVSTVLSILSVWYFFIEPRYSFAISEPTAAAGLGLFAVISVAISFLETPGGLLAPRKTADSLEHPPADLAGTPLVRRIAMIAGAALALGLLASVLWSGFQRSMEAERWVEHTYQVLNASASARASLERAETSERGYLLTGEDQYIEAFESAVASERAERAALRLLTADNRVQQARLGEFDQLLRSRLDMLAAGIEVRKRQGMPAALGLIRTSRGGRLMDQLRAILDAVDEEEHQLIHIRTLAADAADSRTRWILGLGSGSLVFLLILAGADIERQAHHRAAAEKLLERQARLIDLSHDAIITADGNRVITAWNFGAQEMYGWTGKEAAGQTLQELLHTNSAIPVAEVNCILAREDRWIGVLTHTRSDGRQIVVESCQVIQRDDAGRPAGFLEINRDITERKQAEMALSESEGQFRTLANAIPQLCWMANADGWIFWYNERWYQYTGTTPEQMQGWGWQSVHDPEALPEVLARWQGSIASGEPFDMVFPLRGADGAFRPFLTRVMPVRDAGGKVVRWFGTNTDIGEQRKTEEALRESEKRFRSTMDCMLEGGQIISRDWRYVYVNDAAERHNRRPRTELLGKRYMDMWPGIESTNVFAVLKRSMEEHVPQAMENRFVFPDGTAAWFELRIEPVPEGLFILSVDITGRKRAEEALQQSEESFRSLFQSMEEGFTSGEMIYDAADRPIDFQFLAVNPAFGRMTGLSPEQVVGRSARSVIPLIRAFWIEAYARVVQTGKSERVSGLSALGRHMEVLAWRSGPGRFSLIFTDVTDRKRAEEEIRQLNAELGQRVRERTAELEAANKELEAFAYSVSHDLRAPLRGIDGWSLALIEDYGGQMDQRARQYLDRVRSETQRMGNLIDDMLQLSRISRTEMHRDAVDLGPIAEAIAARLREIHSQRRLEFAIRPGLKAFGDARLLEVALTNLLENAVKFTGPRSPARIELDAVECGGKTAFVVRDNGVGFDMAYAATLFGAFQRLHSESEFPGTGIGLATVQRVIHRHGGRIWAEAEPDRGASFYFTIGGEQ